LFLNSRHFFFQLHNNTLLLLLLLYKHNILYFVRFKRGQLLTLHYIDIEKQINKKMISYLEMIYTLYINNDVYSSNELVSLADHRLLGSAVRHCCSAVSGRCVQQFGFRFRYDGFHGK